jgi:hypothetical protein
MRRAPGPSSPEEEALDLLLTWERDLERKYLGRRYVESDGTTALWVDQQKEKRK